LVANARSYTSGGDAGGARSSAVATPEAQTTGRTSAAMTPRAPAIPRTSM
jgi:hypothetical protein